MGCLVFFLNKYLIVVEWSVTKEYGFMYYTHAFRQEIKCRKAESFQFVAE